MNTSKPPFLLLLAAALAIVSGTESTVGMLAKLLQGHLRIDLGCLGIPIGYGLLCGSQTARWWAIWVSALGFVIIAGGLAWGAYSGQFNQIATEDLWLGGMAWGMNLFICAIVFGALRTARVVAWFDDDSADRDRNLGWTATLVLIAILYTGEIALHDAAAGASLRRMFAVHTRFEFHEAGTGKGLMSVNWASDAFIFSSEGQDPLAPRLSVETGGSEDGIFVLFHGISGRPFDVTFDSDGYRPVTYTFDKSPPREISLELRPEPAEAGQSGAAD